MRNVRNVMFVGTLVATLTGSTAAFAAWQDFTYADQQFLVTLPSEPVIATGTYKTADGTSLPDKTYTVTQGKFVFQATVVDFSSTTTKKADVLRSVVAEYLKKGKLIEDTYGRIGSDFGRNLNIDGKNGHWVSSIFFANGRKLYLIDGITLPGGDMGSGLPTRYRESLSFVADPAAAPAGGRGAGGAGGGRGAGGAGRGGRGAAPPADGAAPPAAGAAPAAAPAAAPPP